MAFADRAKASFRWNSLKRGYGIKLHQDLGDSAANTPA
jgi:hypothetical protein